MQQYTGTTERPQLNRELLYSIRKTEKYNLLAKSTFKATKISVFLKASAVIAN